MYVKKHKRAQAQKRTPLMYGLPTPVNRPPAMADAYINDEQAEGMCGWGADDEIEMDPEFVGEGANPNVIGEKPPSSKILGVSTGFLVAGAAVAAYFLFVHKK